MVVSTVGDVGDSVVLLAIISQLGGGPHKLLLATSPITKMKTAPDVAKWKAFFKPLAESQSYIEECREYRRGDSVDWESGGFRGSGLHSRSANLFTAQLSHLQFTKNIGHGFTAKNPWLTVEPSTATNGRIICSRSGRYRNGSFPWKRIVQHYGDRLLFVGFKHEHAEFCSHFGFVEYLPTENLLQMAQYIAGSEMFIGNQSSPMTVAEGLKHRTIQETSTDPSDCIYFRDNAQWVDNGAVELPDICGSGAVKLAPSVCIPTDIITHTTPPGMWQVDGLPPIATFDQAVQMCKINKITPPEGIELEEWIKSINALRAPEFFFGETVHANCKNSEGARRNAGYPPRTIRQMMGI